MTNEQHLAHHYTRYTTTSIMEQDIKSIKKINTCLNKYYRTTREMYIDEVRNILLIMGNTYDLDAGIDFLMYYIEDGYKDIVRRIVEKEEI